MGVKGQDCPSKSAKNCENGAQGAGGRALVVQRTTSDRPLGGLRWCAALVMRMTTSAHPFSF